MKRNKVKISIIILCFLLSFAMGYFAYRQHTYQTTLNTFTDSIQETIKIANTQSSHMEESVHIIKRIHHDFIYDIDKDDTTRFIYPEHKAKNTFKEAMVALQKDTKYQAMFDGLKQAEKSLQTMLTDLKAMDVTLLPEHDQTFYPVILHFITEYQTSIHHILNVENKGDLEDSLDQCLHDLNDEITTFTKKSEALLN